MEELKQNFACTLQQLRAQHKLTQAELAAQLHYSDKAVSKWERAESIPDALALKNIAALFGVTIDYLLEKHDRPADTAQSAGDPQLQQVRHARINRGLITAISVLGVWFIATFVFACVWMVYAGSVCLWQSFVIAVPVSCIVLLVFNCIWGKIRRGLFIISALIWSLLACLYLCLLPYRLWMLFIIGIPLQIVTILAFNFKLPHRSHTPPAQSPADPRPE